jgi:hypothetical protein
MTKNINHSNASTRLHHRLMKLRARRAEQEEQLKRTIRETVAAITPGNLLKTAVHDLRNDPEFRQDAIRQGISMGTGLLLDAIVFRKGFGLKSSLISAGLKKVVSHFLHKKG